MKKFDRNGFAAIAATIVLVLLSTLVVVSIYIAFMGIVVEGTHYTEVDAEVEVGIIFTDIQFNQDGAYIIEHNSGEFVITIENAPEITSFRPESRITWLQITNTNTGIIERHEFGG